jgi:8-oxoguanine deaminase
MARVAEPAARHGCGLHTHLHPRPDEREKAGRHLGNGPVDFLEGAGWLRPGAWFAHCSQLSDEEMQAFAESSVGVAHCPRTTPRLSFPLTRISAMRKYGVNVWALASTAPRAMTADPCSENCGLRSFYIG